MIIELLRKLENLGTQHQVIAALVLTCGIVCISWGIENILEKYVFPHQPFYGYIVTICFGLVLLWLTKHVILHVI